MKRRFSVTGTAQDRAQEGYSAQQDRVQADRVQEDTTGQAMQARMGPGQFLQEGIDPVRNTQYNMDKEYPAVCDRGNGDADSGVL